MAVDYHAMSTGANSGAYYSTQSFASSTDKRDVSELLDLITLGETPFINAIGYGAESGGTTIEWLSEHLGWAYVELSGAIASGATTFIVTTSGLNLAASDAARQLEEGTLLYAWSSTDQEHGLILVTSVTSVTATFEFLTTTYKVSMEASQKLYILGGLANEGSLPKNDQHRLRTILSNNFTIQRKDIVITGSQAATDMYAVSNELRHQTRMRGIELERERQRIALLSLSKARSTTVAATINGVFGFLVGQTGDHINTADRTLTESAFNKVIAACWNNTGMPDSVWASSDQIRKFTAWDRTRVRVTENARRGGFHITRYLTDIGIEVSLNPLRHFPPNLMFILDTGKIKLRAKRGRRALLEKLGKKGDYDEWQLLSEWTLEMRGYDQGQHGAFLRLS